MVKTAKSQFLDSFLDEIVHISTSLLCPIDTDQGVIQAPVVVEGILIDYDSEFLLVSTPGRDSLELVARGEARVIRLIEDNAEVMEDPSRPPVGEMN